MPLIQDYRVLETMLDGRPLTTPAWLNLPRLNLFGDPYLSTMEREPRTSKDTSKVAQGDEERSWGRLSWRPSGGNILLTTGDVVVEGQIRSKDFHIILQHDGNLVLYSVDRSGDYGPAIWSSRTGAKKNIGKDFTLRLKSDGNLVLRRYKDPIWESGYHGNRGPYFAILHPVGDLQIYEGMSPCQRGRLVWSSVAERAQRKGKRDERKAMRVDEQQKKGYIAGRTDICKMHPVDPTSLASATCDGAYVPEIIDFFQAHHSGQGFSLVLKHSGEVDDAEFSELLSFYAGSEYVESIYVSWAEEDTKGRPKDMLIDRTPVYFDSPGFLHPRMRIGTKAALLLDDRIVVDHEDLGFLFETWKSKTLGANRTVVGFFSVEFRPKDWVWSLNSETTKLHLLTTAAMIPVDLLYDLTCVSNRAQRVIDDHEECEIYALSLMEYDLGGFVDEYLVSPRKPVRSARGGGDPALRWASSSPLGECTRLLSNYKNLGRSFQS